ncbi:toxin-antitoxin system YwqK family antitoxin [Mobiluncus mulieris]|uniref:hypothetical protein n=1 Tax=Mobiluncus mulieris TaxID=2052 RepID=UPI0014702C5A|nr:hypothetical protein [Mobiluncus mulieris]MCU9994397.1 hypothetical protein [Mobiluncus mulieris]MCV0014938.1 hypothetical protein [Mobiluncus mulieris]NMX01039.1 hypothetical protein [Mobiluncus mulieris]
MSTPVISTFTDDYGTEHRVFHDAETGTQTEVWEYGSTSETVVSYRDGTLKWATSKNGRIAKISFYDAARVLHCVDGPAIVEYDESEHPRRFRYYQHGQLHRIDAPAVINYDPDGHVRSQQWYRHGLLHRTGGPALTLYDKDGQVASEAWFKDGYLTTTNPSKVRG